MHDGIQHLFIQRTPLPHKKIPVLLKPYTLKKIHWLWLVTCEVPSCRDRQAGH